MSARRNQNDVDSTPVNGATETDYPRRRTHVDSPETAGGYRTSKRSSRAGKKARRSAKNVRRKEDVKHRAGRTGRGLVALVKRGAIILGAAATLLLVLVLVATGVNSLARYIAKRQAVAETSPEALREKAKENLLIIGENGKSGADFLAVRLDENGGQVFGIAVPDGAFMEVPGQGFERIGDSYGAGPEVSMAAISNYLSVPFEKYIVVDQDTYQEALTAQSLDGVMEHVIDTGLDDGEREEIAAFMSGVPSENVALVPLPVKPISLGDQTFFEPQREEVAELLLSWWGVKIGVDENIIRVIVYNGAGIPGIAGEAAQVFIRNGMRVVDTKNADRFDYEETLIVVQDGVVENGQRVKDVLGVGTIVDQASEQDVADIIVIIGADYVRVSEEDTQTGG
ncbi:MAG: LytR C-terminal domain-containing protein [Coriobacteriia bacterium]|nr:LytR C-terminal domain-containing protein [Coriobacteriia bacterium]MBN2823477.1 LytR C-terminal domain-containing protein [Coriobacteriia bacterium]